MDLKNWTLETDDDGIAWLKIDKADSSANVLSNEVMTELNSVIDTLAAQKPRGLVIYSGKNNGFIMGADINEFTAVDSPELAYEVTRLGQELFSKIENLDLPDRDGHQRLLHGGRARNGDGARLSHCTGRQEEDPRTARGQARAAPGFRRHGPFSADLRRASGDADHADRKSGNGRQGSSHRSRRSDRHGRQLAPGGERANRVAAAETASAARRAAAEPSVREAVHQANAHQAGCIESTQGTLPGAVRDDRSLGTLRGVAVDGLRGRGERVLQTHVHAHIAKPRARVLPAEQAEEPGQQDQDEALPRARHRCRRHGRRYRGVVVRCADST